MSPGVHTRIETYMGDHRSYRVLCLQSARQASAGLWDVESIVLKTDPGWSGSTLKVRNVTASGSASDPEHGGYEGYAPANAFLTNGGECLPWTALRDA